MKYVCGIISLIVFGCTGIKQSTLPGRYYRVKPGDTMSSISKAQKISAEEIMETNGIESPRFLRVGQELFLPDPDPIGTKVEALRRTPTKLSSPKQPKAVSDIKPTMDWPVPGGKLFREFSRSKENPYDGIGISAKRGSHVIAAQNGRVLYVGDDGTKFGLLIILEHEDHIITVYTHLQKADVKAEQIIKRGALIGSVGDSGGVSSPRLHFQVRVNERPQNPLNFIKK